MKILKRGIVPSELKMFICDYCGCEFIADKGEYDKYYRREEVMILYAAVCSCCKKYIFSRWKPSNKKISGGVWEREL